MAKKWRSKKWLRKRAKRNHHKMTEWALEDSVSDGKFWAATCKRCGQWINVWVTLDHTCTSGAARKKCWGKRDG